VSSSADSKDQQDTKEAGKEGREAERLATLEYLRAVRPGVGHVLQELVDEVRGVYGTDLCMVNLRFGRFFFTLALVWCSEPNGVFRSSGHWVIAYLLGEERELV
jgi:hypothetical protein